MNEILALLSKDARLTDAQIAQRLGKTEGEVREAIAALESSKVILGYQAIVNANKLEDNGLIGIIEIKISPQRETGFDSIAQRISRYPEVKLCYLLSGGYDLLVFVEGATLKDVAIFVAEKLASVDNVVSTTTHFILKKYKEVGVMLAEPETTERLAVSP